jgi:NADPH2:quinone reductase
VLKEGAHAVFNHRDEDYLQRIKDSTRDGAGVDLVIEMLANVNLAKDLDVIKRGGSVVIVGSRGELNFAPRYVLNTTALFVSSSSSSYALHRLCRLIMAKEAIVTAVALAQSTPEELVEHHAFIGAGLANGTLRPVVDKEFALGDAPKAHEEVISGTHAGKIVLLP